MHVNATHSLSRAQGHVLWWNVLVAGKCNIFALSPLFLHRSDAQTAAKGKKGKGLKLPPDHEDALVHCTACLKLLCALSNANAYRVAKLQALPLLVQMAEHPRLKLRRNAQARCWLSYAVPCRVQTAISC